MNIVCESETPGGNCNRRMYARELHFFEFTTCAAHLIQMAYTRDACKPITDAESVVRKAGDNVPSAFVEIRIEQPLCFFWQVCCSLFVHFRAIGQCIYPIKEYIE